MEIQRPDKPRAVKVKFASGNSVPPKTNPAPKNARPAMQGAKPNPQAKRPVAKGAPSPVKKPNGAPQKLKLAQKKAESRAQLNKKIITQTRGNRAQVRKTKKVGGSIKNLEIKRRSTSSKQKFYVKKKKGNLGKLLLSRLILFFIIFGIMFSFVAMIFNSRLKAGSIETGRSYTLQLGEDKAEDDYSDYQPEYVEIPEECAQRNDTVYIPVSALIDLCSLTVTGTQESLRYIPRDSGNQTMSFEVGSNLAKINGTTIRMNAPTFTFEGKLYVPLDFFLNYSSGLNIDHDAANAKITISAMNIGYDAATDSKIYDNLGFKTFKTEALALMPEPIE